jgi:TatD family-associated radical SAM protein
MDITYKYNGSLYVNLTNKCILRCTYCIKHKWKGKFRGYDLFLKKEPSAAMVIKAIGNPKNYKEIIFCGYGEPLLKLKELIKTAEWVKKKGGKVRVNTSGNANLHYKKNIVPKLEGLVDAVSISLNGCNEKDYLKLNRPLHGKQAFKAVLEFVKESKKYIPEVTITTVELPGAKIGKCRQLAKKLGVNFRTRPYLDDYENA